MPAISPLWVGALIYKKVGVSVIPVALNLRLCFGVVDLLPKGRWGKIIIEFLPVSIVLSGWSEAFISELESQVEKATNRLIAEGLS